MTLGLSRKPLPRKGEKGNRECGERGGGWFGNWGVLNEELGGQAEIGGRIKFIGVKPEGSALWVAYQVDAEVLRISDQRLHELRADIHRLRSGLSERKISHTNLRADLQGVVDRGGAVAGVSVHSNAAAAAD